MPHTHLLELNVPTDTGLQAQCECGGAIESCECGTLTTCTGTWDKAHALGVLTTHRPARIGGGCAPRGRVG